MELYLGDLLVAKLQIKEMPEIKVGVYLLVDKKTPRFLLLNMPYPNKVCELLPSLSYSDQAFAGGDQFTDKVYFIHKFKSVSNAQKIAKDLYFAGDFSEIELLDKHGKLNADNCRFFLGYYTTDISTLDKNRFKKIGTISKEEIFMPFDKIQEYWENVYVNYLIDTSDLQNIDSAEDTNSDATPTGKSFVKSFLWTKSWLILSALMNAISLINIGIDLKVVTIRWVAFLSYALGFVRQLAHVLISPISYIFSFIHVEIPILVKDVFLLTSILITSLVRALYERDKKFKKGTAAITTKRKLGKVLSLIVKACGQILMGMFFGVTVAAFTWIFKLLIGNHAISIVLTVMALVLVIISIPNSDKAKNIEASFVKDTMRFYVFSVIFFLLLIALINWFFIVYKASS